ELRAADAVARGQQRRVRVLLLRAGDGAGEGAAGAQGTVEVVEAEQVHLVAGVSGLRPERQDEAGERYRHGADARGRAPCGPAGRELEHGCLLEDKWEKRVLLRHSTPCVTRHAQGFSSAEASRHRTFTWAVRSVTLLGCRMACGLPALDSPRPPAPPSKCPHPMRAPHRPCRPECACGAVPASAPDAELHASDAAPHPPPACDIPVALAPAALDPVALDRYRSGGERAPWVGYVPRGCGPNWSAVPSTRRRRSVSRLPRGRSVRWATGPAPAGPGTRDGPPLRHPLPTRRRAPGPATPAQRLPFSPKEPAMVMPFLSRRPTVPAKDGASWPHVIILGGGFAGAHAVTALRDAR